MKIDVYTLKARIAPSAVTVLIPILVFNHFLASEEVKKLIGDILGLKLLSAVTVSAVLIIFLAELSRAISKQIFQILLFEDELRMPTTQFMMCSDPTFSNDFKIRFRAQVAKDFLITLPTAADETENELEARKKISEAITAVRKKLHKNAFLLQHNIEYGAIRNSLGGAVLAALLSLLDVFLFARITPNPLAMHISIVIAVLYCMWVALGPWLVRLYGRSYARILFREYMK